MDRKPLAENLATTALAGPLEYDGLVTRFGEGSRPRRFHLVRFLLADEGFAHQHAAGLVLKISRAPTLSG